MQADKSLENLEDLVKSWRDLESVSGLEDLELEMESAKIWARPESLERA